MQLELATGGNLYEYIALEPLNAEISRYYFVQLINVLHYCHSEGKVHRDLKPANVLLDSNFNIKLADFGFTNKGKNLGAYLQSFKGTEGYVAPEILALQPYKGPPADVYSLGVLLFNMHTGHSPCKENAFPNDPLY